MTEMHVPAHITLTRQIAQQEAATVTALTVTEQQLKAQLDEHQRDAAAEQKRIEAEIEEFVEKRRQHLAALAETGRRLTSELTGVGRQLRQHSDEATDAQQTVLDWCTRRGINVTDLPPLRDTGPMPAIPAPVEPARPPVEKEPCPAWNDAHPVGTPVLYWPGERTGPGIESTTRSPAWPLGDGTPVVSVDGCTGGIALTHVLPLDEADAPATAEPKLPAIEEPDGLLAQAAAMANPNGAATTQVDLPAGGDQPEPSGPFPGGVESPAGPRPKRNRRRPQSDRVTEQNGDDRG